MSARVVLGGKLAEAAGSVISTLVEERLASRITSGDPTAWGAAAESEASIRLGWVNAPEVSAPLVPEILSLRDELRAKGVTHIVLGGMGGSSLAPELITRTYGTPLTVLDSTVPTQVAAAFTDPEHTAVVVSSKSGSTVETDSHRRTAEAWFTAAGIDPAERIVIVTDPGSPLDVYAREHGYTVFNADPHVGGRFSALTAFGLVPSGLAGADIQEVLDDAAAQREILSHDSETNPAVLLAAALTTYSPLKDKIGLLSDGTGIVGFPDWTEQLVAESLGKQGTGVLPVVLDAESPELENTPDDLTLIRLVELAALPDADAVKVSGSLGEMLILWEYAISMVGRILGINPFDQPDVESAKAAARALLSEKPAPVPARLTDAGIEARGTAALFEGVSTIVDVVRALFSQLDPDRGYLAIQAYLDRPANPDVPVLRDLVAETTGRPTTFGWGPRFLHSTGQYHKGGPAEGVFLQITADTPTDIDIPGIPFTFGQLVTAQAAGDAQVLADHGRPVLSLHLHDVDTGVATLRSILTELR